MQLSEAPSETHGLVSSVIRFIDYQADALGSGAWQALALPGSTLSIVLTGFLTLFIAIIGYNLLLGHTLTVRAGPLAMVKIGIFLALATSWPAYRTLVYDVVVAGPAQLVSEMGGPARVPGSDGSLLQRLDVADRALAELAILGSGNPPVALNGQTSGQLVVPPPFGGFNAFALGGARIVFLLTAISALAVVRIVSGLMLALGPFFIAFLLFESTRSLFEGWIRVIAGAALGAIGASIVLGLQLALVEPWLANILAARQADEALPSVPTELLVVVSVFAMVAIAALTASARLARAFRLAPILRWTEGMFQPAQSDANVATSTGVTSESARSERMRASNVVDVLVAAQRREARWKVSGPAGHDGQRVNVAPGDGPQRHGAANAQPVSVGRTFRRRARARVTTSAERRDRTA
jgi:type IV secretion system protein VirB6